jgi:hypothetical protein
MRSLSSEAHSVPGSPRGPLLLPRFTYSKKLSVCSHNFVVVYPIYPIRTIYCYLFLRNGWRVKRKLWPQRIELVCTKTDRGQEKSFLGPEICLSTLVSIWKTHGKHMENTWKTHVSWVCYVCRDIIFTGFKRKQGPQGDSRKHGHNST